MSLAQRVGEEFDVPTGDVMLLRHSRETVKKLLAAGGTIDEYTVTQPTGSSYDYLDAAKGAVLLVVVIVDDQVYGVFKVLGIESEGTTYSLTSAAHQQFDIERGKPARPARRFAMRELQSAYTGLTVSGWEGGRTRTAVQRSNGAFFWHIDVVPGAPVSDYADLELALARNVDSALARTSKERRARLVVAPKLPRRVTVTSVAFVRNADVVAEVLLRASGLCELCNTVAPFIRRKDGTPYLEVHHKLRLVDGGEDTVENAIAICPNCHRREHHA